MLTHAPTISKQAFRPHVLKFTPNPRHLFAFYTNSPPTGHPPFLSMTKPSASQLRDKFYDYRASNVLSDGGRWLRQRNGIWELIYKTPAGLRSTFSTEEIWSAVRECAGYKGVKSVVEREVAMRRVFGAKVGEENEKCLREVCFGLDLWADIMAERETVTIDEEFDVSIDRTDFGVFGEVELRDDSDLESILPVWERYSWFFADNKKGKLAQYSEGLRGMLVRKGISVYDVERMNKVRVFEKAIGWL